MSKMAKALSILVFAVAALPWLPHWFRFTGLSEASADFWSLTTVLAFLVVTGLRWIEGGE